MDAAYRVVVSDRAKCDIDEHQRWWVENRSPEQAGRWYRGIVAALVELDHNPRRFSLAREDVFAKVELRYVPFGLGRHTTHRVLFTIDDDAAVVRVLLVHHVAQADVDPGDLAD